MKKIILLLLLIIVMQKGICQDLRKQKIIELCIADQKNDSLISLVGIPDFLTCYKKYKFTKRIKISSDNIVFKTLVEDTVMGLLKGYNYGILVTDHKLRIPIIISNYGYFFIELLTNRKYIISKETRGQWDSYNFNPISDK